MWLLALRALARRSFSEGGALARRSFSEGGNSDAFVVSLALTLACYVVLAWTVVYIRELRHMLPFSILVVPLAVAELEYRLKE
jgi:hypothetical protein